MNLRTMLVLLTGLLATIPVSLAATEDRAVTELRAKLTERFPGVPIKRITAAEWPGMYEVIAGGDMVYTNAGADWVIMGQMVDVKTRENLTTRSWDDFMRIDYKALPFEKAITVVQGGGSRHVAVFEDPFCPFCEELEETLQGIDDVTIHVFLYPLETLHPGATLASTRIWCAPERAAAWTAWMRDGRDPPAPLCEGAPLQELGRLGARLNVEQTPTLFFPDGSRISGAADKSAIERRLSGQMSGMKPGVSP